jgi:hypothetical protein
MVLCGPRDAVKPLGLVAACRHGQNGQQMTITYFDGTVLESLLLSRGNNSLRAAVPGDDDARTFTLVNNAWISESGERVKIEVAWERRGQANIPMERECVCSKKLASCLVSMLLAGSNGDDLIEDMLYVYSAEGSHVRIQSSRLGGRARGSENVG